MGEGRQGLCVRRTGRQGDARRPVRRPQPADRQALHAGPGWKEGCLGCSFGADQLDGSVVHLINHDVMFVAISRAPYSEIAAYHKRMGWTFEWVSSFGSDFNFDSTFSFTEEEKQANRSFYNFEEGPYFPRRAAGLQRVLQGRGGRHLPHLFDLLPGRHGIMAASTASSTSPPRAATSHRAAIFRLGPAHDEYEEKPGDSCCHG